METEFLNPKAKLVDVVVGWLVPRARKTPAGVASLAHVLVVVPTAQAGRQLRFALAKRFASRGVLPPGITLPIRLVEPADGTFATASPVDAEAVLVDFLEHADFARWPTLFPKPPASPDATWALGLAAQLDGIWSALGADGLLMRDVPARPAAREVLRAALGDEVARWEELAALEAGYFAALHARGLRHPSEALALAASAPKALPPEIGQIVLPAPVDPPPVLYPVLEAMTQARPGLDLTVLIHADQADGAKFDAWGRPVPEAWTGARAPLLPFRDEDIFLSGDGAAEARAVAAAFPPPDAGRESPALGLVDSSLFPALEAAFLSRGYDIHNPERHELAVSSLGRLALDILSLTAVPRPAWSTFAAFLRADDVLDWLCPATRAAVLAELDRYRNERLPVTMPADIPDETDDRTGLSKFANLAAAVAVLRRTVRAEADPVAALPRALAAVFAHRKLFAPEAGRHGAPPGDRELAAASDALMELVATMDSPAVQALPPADRLALFRARIAKATYQLEPETNRVLQTEGWLELAWSPAAAVALAGMTEGSVPDAIVGHPFLPDALRAALGVESNARRLARDTYLLAELCASRAPGMVRAFCGLADSRGEVQKPSRLLFLCDDKTLPGRVERLFSEPDAPPSTPPRLVPPAWRLALPADLPPPARLSPSAIDAFLKCPFTYYLGVALGMKPQADKAELGSDDFGNLCHGVLRDYAADPVAAERGATPADVRAAFERIFARHAAVYGAAPGANTRLQLESARERLAAFAAIQSARQNEGWRICAAERKMAPAVLFDDVPIALGGIIDRIDVNDDGDYCVVDYKTWDKLSDEKYVDTSKKEVAFAELRGLPPSFEVAATKAGKTTAKPRRWLAVQLPLYGLMLERNEPAVFKGRILDYRYAILGATPETTGWVGDMDGQNGVPIGGGNLADELATAHAALCQVAAGLFWPPGPSDAWEGDFAPLFLADPRQEVPEAWRTEMERRLETWKSGRDRGGPR